MHFYFHYKNSYKFENDFMEKKKISFNKFNYKKGKKNRNTTIGNSKQEIMIQNFRCIKRAHDRADVGLTFSTKKKGKKKKT